LLKKQDIYTLELNSIQKEILELLKKNKQMDIDQIIEQLLVDQDLKKKRTIQYHLNNLKKLDLIELKGSARQSYWCLK
jgi:predicted HTH transcriptional regulator